MTTTSSGFQTDRIVVYFLCKIENEGMTMAIKSQENNDKLILELDNGDYDKLIECMEKWSFKDHQSMLRFAMSVLLVSEDRSLSIKMDGRQQAIAPAKEYLKD